MIGLVRLAMATQVNRDDPVAIAETSELVFEHGSSLRPAVDEHEWFTLTLLLVL